MRTLCLLSANVLLLAAIGFTHAKKWSTNKDSIIIEADNDDGILSDETIDKIECRTIDSEVGQCVTVRRCHPILFTDDGAIRNKELAETFATTDASCVTEVLPKSSSLDIGDRTICCAVSKLLSALRTGLDEELELYPTTIGPNFGDDPEPQIVFNDEPHAEELSSVTTVDPLLLDDGTIVLDDEPVQTTSAPSSIILSHLINRNPTAEPIPNADEPVQTTLTPLVNNQIVNDENSPANDAVLIENLFTNSVDKENILEDAPSEVVSAVESTTVREDIIQDDPVATTQDTVATVLAEKIPAQEIIPVQDESLVNEFDAPAPTTVREELQDEVVTTSAPLVKESVAIPVVAQGVKEIEEIPVSDQGIKPIEEIPGDDQTVIPEVQTTTAGQVALSQTEIPAAVSDEAQTVVQESGSSPSVDQGELLSESHPTTDAPQRDVVASETTVVPEVEIPVESQTGIYSFPSTSVEPETTAQDKLAVVPVESEGQSLTENSPSSDSSGDSEVSPSVPEVSSSVVPETTVQYNPTVPVQSEDQSVSEVSPSSDSSGGLEVSSSVPELSSSVLPETTSQSTSIVPENSEGSVQSEVSPSSDSSAEPEVISPLPEISSSVAPEVPVQVSSEAPVHSEPKPEISSESPPPVAQEPEESNPVPDRPFEGCPNVATYNQWPVFHDYPFLASILTRSKTGPLCSGSLIDARHVLTAAHCLHRFNSRDVAGMQVRLGFSKHIGNDTLEHHYIERRASKVILHKHFHAQNKMDNNIALVQLNKPVVFDEHVYPINIFREVDGYDEGNCTATQAGFIRFGNRIVTEIGDGFINFIEAPMGDFFLRESLSRVYTKNECKTDLHSQVTDKMVCAKPEVFEAEGITGIFKGNDGGPLLVKDGNQILQIGIKSWAYEGNQYPTVYTKVDSYFKWIADNLKM